MSKLAKSTEDEGVRDIETLAGWWRCPSCMTFFPSALRFLEHEAQQHSESLPENEGKEQKFEIVVKVAPRKVATKKIGPKSKMSKIDQPLPHKCDYCDYASLRRDLLSYHIAQHHTADKKFKCPHCSYSTPRSAHLVVHIRSHTGEKPFKCNYPKCNLKFSSTSGLLSHRRVHTGDRPFKCPHCPYAASRRAHLQLHQKIHTGEKKICCVYDNCNHQTTSASQLTIHVKNCHLGVRPFKCTFCPYASARNPRLQDHIERHHAELLSNCN